MRKYFNNAILHEKINNTSATWLENYTDGNPRTGLIIVEIELWQKSNHPVGVEQRT
jgi:hypothetical protein